MQKACIHLGQYEHPIRIGNCRDACKKIDALIEEHIE